MYGREPIPMMDRRRAHELPQMQVGFCRGICIPCYELIAEVLPQSTQLLERSKYVFELLRHGVLVSILKIRHKIKGTMHRNGKKWQKNRSVAEKHFRLMTMLKPVNPTK